MSYYLLGSNHELADTSFSSKIAFDAQKLERLHSQLLEQGLADCALILSTCNRSEILLYKRKVKNLELWVDEINSLVFKIHGISTEDLKRFYRKVNQEAVLHLFKVACGLDSLVLGEAQILAQIKDAISYTENFYAHRNLKIPAEFYKLIDETFACSKEVRTKTSIGKYAVSIAYMACQLARNIFSDFSVQNIVLVGASQTNLLLSRHLVRNNITNLTVVNRSLANANNFIQELGFGQTATLDNLEEQLVDSSLIFSSTSANNHIITKEILARVQEKRGYKNLLLFDLAIPNDIEPSAREIDGVNLFNRDDLQTLVNQNKQKRYESVKEALPILAKYLNHFREQNRILQGNEIIVEYRNSVHQHRINLVNEAKEAIKRGTDIEEVLDTLSYSLTNKILHTPTLMLSSFIKNGQTCELKSIHEYLDRTDKTNFSTIVENTLNKDIFRNNCCKSNNNDPNFECCSKNDPEKSFNELIYNEFFANQEDSEEISTKDSKEYSIKDLDEDSNRDFNKDSNFKVDLTNNKEASQAKCPFHAQIKDLSQDNLPPISNSKNNSVSNSYSLSKVQDFSTSSFSSANHHSLNNSVIEDVVDNSFSGCNKSIREEKNRDREESRVESREESFNLEENFDFDLGKEINGNFGKCPVHKAMQRDLQALDANAQCPVTHPKSKDYSYFNDLESSASTKRKTKPKFSSFEDVEGVFVPMGFDEEENMVLNELARIIDSEFEADSSNSLYSISTSLSDNQLKVIRFNKSSTKKN